MTTKTIETTNASEVGSTVHCFERAGLGKAPFAFQGSHERTYQACPGAPIQPAGTCAYCGQGIRYCFIIRSSDGKLFEVGSDCVEKTDDAGLRRLVDAKVRALKREATHKRQDEQIEEGKRLIAQAPVAAALEAQVITENYYHSNRLSLLTWYLSNAGRSGASWAAREVIKMSKTIPVK